MKRETEDGGDWRIIEWGQDSFMAFGDTVFHFWLNRVSDRPFSFFFDESNSAQEFIFLNNLELHFFKICGVDESFAALVESLHDPSPESSHHSMFFDDLWPMTDLEKKFVVPKTERHER